MFENDTKLNEQMLEFIKNGQACPMEGFKLSEDGKALVRKTEEEILSNDWNSCVERKCEYIDYLDFSISEMEKFLNSTDWYVTRKYESGKDIPKEIFDKRELYRNKISRFRYLLEHAKTII